MTDPNPPKPRRLLTNAMRAAMYRAQHEPTPSEHEQPCTASDNDLLAGDAMTPTKSVQEVAARLYAKRDARLAREAAERAANAAALTSVPPVGVSASDAKAESPEAPATGAAPQPRGYPRDEQDEKERERTTRNNSGTRGRKLLARCHSAGVDLVARSVLLGLALHESKERLAHPSHDTLAVELGTDRATVARALQRLGAAGLVTSTKVRKWNGGTRWEHVLADTQGDDKPDAPFKVLVRTRQTHQKRAVRAPSRARKAESAE